MFNFDRHPWLKYDHTSVRDLAWVLLSPALFNQTLGEFDAYSLAPDLPVLDEWLSALDENLKRNPASYPEIHRSSHRRLGLYCESLIEFYLKNAKIHGIEDVEYVARNVQLRGESTTLGECDFIVSKLKKALHIELAVKFYLQHPAGHSEWNAWIGPNAIDRLDLKIERMISHQLPLLHRIELKNTVSEIKQKLKIANELGSEHLIKGLLFLPFGPKAKDVLPVQSNPKLPTGYWMNISEFLEFCSKEHAKFLFCEKMDWLTGPEDLSSTNNTESIVEKIKALYDRSRKENKNTPAILLQMVYENEGTCFMPMMIVPDHWPETNSPLRRI